MDANKKKIKLFNKDELIYKLLIMVFIFIIGFLVYKVVNNIGEVDTFKSISKKQFKEISNKDEALNIAYEKIGDVSQTNYGLSPTNLNIAKMYKIVNDDEERNFYKENSPVPVTIDSIIEDKKDGEEEEVEIVEPKTSAFQIYEKMQKRYEVLRQSLYNMVGTKPVNIVRQYQYDGFSIIGKYNPEDPTHVVGKRHTWFITNFQNVNIYYQDGDGNPIDDDNNIKDIMSMASVYTYYKNPYDVDTFLKYCYNLFDNSYSCVASVSEVYYCSGCMHYDNSAVATGSVIHNYVTYEKIKTETNPQKVLPKDIPYKAGTLQRHNNSHTLTEGDYSSYVKGIYNGNTNPDLNYCPGHIDLKLYVTILTIDADYSLFDIDNTYGNKGYHYTKNWHGWDAFKKNEVRLLSYKDWEAEYGLSVSYLDFIEPLTQEEINYYLSRLDDNLSQNRVDLIETALRSIGRIPYYYGGKTHNFGYEKNEFGSKVPADYKGRCLKGLDCSGWINWVFGTTFNKYIIKSEGTNKLAGEGTKIVRDELLPGDIIVRPGIDSHVMMFYEWGPDGKMTVIHENGGVNNVSIGTFDAYYPYYRRILNS